ncbi:hypothetical protein Dimus_017545 [Dionaea muscipula]
MAICVARWPHAPCRINRASRQCPKLAAHDEGAREEGGFSRSWMPRLAGARCSPVDLQLLAARRSPMGVSMLSERARCSPTTRLRCLATEELPAMEEPAHSSGLAVMEVCKLICHWHKEKKEMIGLRLQ